MDQPLLMTDSGDVLFREFLAQHGMNSPSMRLELLSRMLHRKMKVIGLEPVALGHVMSLKTLTGQALAFALEIVRSGELQASADPQFLARQVNRDQP